MKVQYLPCVIASGQTVGAAVALGSDSDTGSAVVAIYIPASFEGTALTFQGSMDNSTFAEVITSAGTALSYTVAAGKWLTVPANDLAGYLWVKPVSGTQVGANRTLQFAIRPVA